MPRNYQISYGENKHANTETNIVWNILGKARAYKAETKS